MWIVPAAGAAAAWMVWRRRRAARAAASMDADLPWQLEADRANAVLRAGGASGDSGHPTWLHYEATYAEGVRDGYVELSWTEDGAAYTWQEIPRGAAGITRNGRGTLSLVAPGLWAGRDSFASSGAYQSWRLRASM